MCQHVKSPLEPNGERKYEGIRIAAWAYRIAAVRNYEKSMRLNKGTIMDSVLSYGRVDGWINGWMDRINRITRISSQMISRIITLAIKRFVVPFHSYSHFRNTDLSGSSCFTLLCPKPSLHVGERTQSSDVLCIGMVH